MTISHLVITDVDERGDPIHGSSAVEVLAEKSPRSGLEVLSGRVEYGVELPGVKTPG
jgi:hypothetical protein